MIKLKKLITDETACNIIVVVSMPVRPFILVSLQSLNSSVPCIFSSNSCEDIKVILYYSYFQIY